MKIKINIHAIKRIHIPRDTHGHELLLLPARGTEVEQDDSFFKNITWVELDEISTPVLLDFSEIIKEKQKQ